MERDFLNRQLRRTGNEQDGLIGVQYLGPNKEFGPERFIQPYFLGAIKPYERKDTQLMRHDYDAGFIRECYGA